MIERSKMPDFNEAGVFQWVDNHRGTRYQVVDLARRFRVPTHAMKPIVLKLAEDGKIVSSTNGKKRVYFLRIDEEVKKLSDLPLAFASVKPLTGYDAMMRRIAENCVCGR